MSETIPIIDIADFSRVGPARSPAAARQVHDALTTVGFFVLTGHDVPPPLIDRTFGEARRFHDAADGAGSSRSSSTSTSTAIWSMGRYAVRTSEVNNNDKGDLNEAFFIKRERPADDPLLLSGRRFVGPNQWPANPTCRVPRRRRSPTPKRWTAFARRLLPAVAVALDLPPDWFDEAFSDSQFTFRLSHYPPVTAEPNQFGIAPHTDSNFMTFLAQSEVPGLQVRLPTGDWLEVPLRAGLVRGQFRRHADALDATAGSNRRRTARCRRSAATATRSRSSSGRASTRVIECLPTCTGSDNPPRWPPITYAEWQEYWYDANYPRRTEGRRVSRTTAVPAASMQMSRPRLVRRAVSSIFRRRRRGRSAPGGRLRRARRPRPVRSRNAPARPRRRARDGVPRRPAGRCVHRHSRL